MLLVVAGALCRREDKHVLLAQRQKGKAMAGLWEFPGGQVETGEAPKAALIRELREELGITATDLTPLAFASKSCDLLLLLWSCVAWEGEPSGVEGRALRWVHANDL